MKISSFTLDNGIELDASFITENSQMNRILTTLFLLTILTISAQQIEAQCRWDTELGLYLDQDGNLCNNTVMAAIPFLRIVPDARVGALGNAGTTLTPDGMSPKYNNSSTAFSDQGLNASLSYTPWLRGITNDVNLLMASGYYKWDAIQAVSLNFTYFNLGEIQFTDETGNPGGIGHPNEFSLSAGYARMLSDKFALSAAANYIYSNLAAGQSVGLHEINVGHAFSVDIGMRYEQAIKRNQTLILGLNLADIGTKISYVKGKDYFIPANIALGANYTFQLDDYNRISLLGEASKLMVPTPPLSGDQEDVDNYLGMSSIQGIFSSFGDAPNGFREEIAEIAYSLGAEYDYNNVLALRAGYYHQSVIKGNIQYITAGFGVNYNVYGFNFSYLVSANGQASPLNNTMRFTLTLNFTSANMGS